MEKGAVVRNCVLYSDVVVEAGATLDWAVVDRDCRIGRGAVLGDPSVPALDDSDAVILVGRGSTVGAGVVLDRVPASSPAARPDATALRVDCPLMSACDIRSRVVARPADGSPARQPGNEFRGRFGAGDVIASV